MKTPLTSKVEGFTGPCKPTWLNHNQVCQRLDGGVSGFFKAVRPVKFLGMTFWLKHGNEFHGILRWGDTEITSTKP